PVATRATSSALTTARAMPAPWFNRAAVRFSTTPRHQGRTRRANRTNVGRREEGSVWGAPARRCPLLALCPLLPITPTACPLPVAVCPFIPHLLPGSVPQVL